jgi:hypothetical protein
MEKATLSTPSQISPSNAGCAFRNLLAEKEAKLRTAPFDMDEAPVIEE